MKKIEACLQRVSETSVAPINTSV